MIISHKYKYVFIELPMTGSTAIARELMEHYEGEKILAKHASPKDFWRTASAEEKEYFMFSGIRNPLDEVVSRYFKYKTDHNQKFSRPLKKKKLGKFRRRLNRIRDNARYNFIIKKGASFQQYFMRYYALPYSNWSMVWHHKMDYIVRFDQLNEDFMEVLKRLEIEPIRNLPQKNKTSGKDGSYWDFYKDDTHQRRAVNVFGAFMKEWDFTFPEHWKQKEPSTWSKILFPVVHGIRKLYWKTLR